MRENRKYGSVREINLLTIFLLGENYMTTRQKLICLLLLPLLASCASAYKNEGDPEGKVAFVIECREETSGCFAKAKELCPKGYVTTHVSAVGATSLLLFAVQLRTLEVQCK